MDKCECFDGKNNKELYKPQSSYRKKRRRYNNVLGENIIDPICNNLIDPIREYKKPCLCEDKKDPVRECKKSCLCEDKRDPICDDKKCKNLDNCARNDPHENNFYQSIKNHIGQTVTIFTTSGGQSGSGFTGVIMGVERNFVRLLTQIGPGPGCALGNECCEDPCLNIQPNLQSNILLTHAPEDSKLNYNKFSLGSEVIIPLNTIAAFVHNAVGSSL
jgi:hypothetical protein